MLDDLQHQSSSGHGNTKKWTAESLATAIIANLSAASQVESSNWIGFDLFILLLKLDSSPFLQIQNVFASLGNKVMVASAALVSPRNASAELSRDDALTIRSSFWLDSLLKESRVWERELGLILEEQLIPGTGLIGDRSSSEDEENEKSVTESQPSAATFGSGSVSALSLSSFEAERPEHLLCFDSWQATKGVSFPVLSPKAKLANTKASVASNPAADPFAYVV
jgi:hypothetical protein